MKKRFLFKALSIAIVYLAFSCFSTGVFADRPLTIKLGTLVPKGSFYHRALQEVAEQWRQVQGKNSRFIIYTDGTQGGEADTVRRMRIGQLNAALLSVVGLSEIDQLVTALQFMPMMFRSWDEVDYVRDKLRPRMEEQLRSKGFIVLFWVEGGWVRFFSKKPAVSPADFKGRRIFVWAGDNQQVEIMKSLGYHPVVLETSDILPALQSGLVNVVAVPAVYALSGQIDGPAPYMSDIKWVPIAGAAVISLKTWEAMTSEARETLARVAAKAGRKLRKRRQPLEKDAIEAMKNRGLQVQTLTPTQLHEWHKLAESVYPRIRGKKVPADIFDQVQQLLSEYRATGNERNQ